MASLLALGAGAVAWEAAARPARALLLADTNRDGQVTAADAAGRGEWTPGRGAIVVPNLDDDLQACPSLAPDGERLSDDALAACSDGADEVVNGAADLLDMAPLRIGPKRGLGAGATATVAVDGPAGDAARLFVQGGDGDYSMLGPDDPITADRLRDGVDLVLEATGFAETDAGFIDVALSVRDGRTVETDRVRIRIAPLLLAHDLAPIDRLIVSDNGTAVEDAERHGYDPAASPPPVHEGEAAFREDLVAGLESAGLEGRLTMYPTGDDRWMRDQFITGYASMPGPGGDPHTLTVVLRSAVVDPEGSTPEFPLRDAGRPAFTLLQGPDTAVVQTYSPERVGQDEYNALWGSFSSTGNVIVAPPHAAGDGARPAGRVLYGSDGGEAAPDPAFVDFLAAQADQDPLAIDTSWLGVGHIDEFLSFTAADNDRGWAAVVADPALGARLLEALVDDGLGGQGLVQGAAPDGADLTVAQALEAPEIVEGNRIAAEGIDAALAVLARELGLGEDEIVRVPALFTELVIEGYPRQDIVANHMPAIVNGVETGTGAFLAIQPHGPLDAAGRDVYAAAAEAAFADAGSRIAWVEAWDYGHAVGTVGGEIHCLTNSIRDQTGTAPWWRN
ncbi:protein-arginine deiminase domain-containing protein [Glycomyces sp. A-F 0318]|uniref:protein-arginine deiminase domain-containing protein n=1 Tax=Glycomyces amatae TaxID=2881355 RepID=UPI001E5DD861|nr:protein-arginine deiminase domain-containing protein [Glycomyces amatae]MCD0447273.1 protein-arginine deiminase domain-containing protein [Glycomyces amatae]